MKNLLQVGSFPSEFLITTLIILGVFLALFLLLRALMLWYWRVNDIIKNQEIQINQQYEIIQKLSQIAEINLRKDRGPNIEYKQ